MVDATEAEQVDWLERHPRIAAFLRHPASILVWFTLFSLVIKEQYPFSHYPMYSSWGSSTHYFYLSDADGPIQAKTVFKVSVPRMKKLYGGILEGVEDELGKSHSELTDADFAEAGRRLLQQLREEAPAKRRKKHGAIIDSELTVVRVDIARDGRVFSKVEANVVTTGADNKIIPTPPQP